jgi:hypothetical protein
MKIDPLGPVRLAMLILFLIGTRGTPFFWLGFCFLLREISIYIKLRR